MFIMKLGISAALSFVFPLIQKGNGLMESQGWEVLAL